MTKDNLSAEEKRAVKALRIVLGLSQTVFAQVLGVAKKTVEAREAGRKVPRGVVEAFVVPVRGEPDVHELYHGGFFGE